MKPLLVTLSAAEPETVAEKIYKKFVPKKKSELLVVHGKVKHKHISVGENDNVIIVPFQNKEKKVDASIAKKVEDASKVITGWDYLPERFNVGDGLIYFWYTSVFQDPKDVVSELTKVGFKVKEVTLNLKELTLLQLTPDEIDRPLTVVERWKLLGASNNKFTEWEENFFQSILSQLMRFKEPTEKQMIYINKMLTKYKVPERNEV